MQVVSNPYPGQALHAMQMEKPKKLQKEGELVTSKMQDEEMTDQTQDNTPIERLKS